MASIKSLKGKKILITSWSYASFGGAALNAVELAEKLVEFGMVPTFFSYDIEGPLRDRIESKFNTTVLTDRVHKLADSDSEEDMGNTQLNINDFDYIWVGGNTLPISIINQINSARVLPKFIFIHMSSLISYPLDAPLMPRLEREVASKILSTSARVTTDNIERIIGNGAPVGYWKNPVPDKFKDVPERNGKLRKIAVISSSNPSDEVIEMGPLLEKEGINVEYIGKFNDNEKVVDPDFYNEYDAVVGIGKDARYALVSGVPIYVYGRFGGFGYLNDDNIESANLSGRGHGKKTAGDIAKEIVDGYSDALKFHQANKDRFTKEMTIGGAARDLFAELETLNSVQVKFEEEYINWLVTTQINIMHRVQIAAARRHWKKRASTLQEDRDMLRSRLESMKSKVDKLQSEKSKLKLQVSEFHNSTSWRITAPFRAANALVKKVFKGGG